jgi:hypothetical protein
MSPAWLASSLRPDLSPLPSPPGRPSFGAFREAGIVLLAILLLTLVLTGATYLATSSPSIVSCKSATAVDGGEPGRRIRRSPGAAACRPNDRTCRAR